MAAKHSTPAHAAHPLSYRPTRPEGCDATDYEIQTAAGPVQIEEQLHRNLYSGTPEALCALLPISDLWFPGYPGNGKTQQTTQFDAAGNAVLRTGRKGPISVPHIKIIRVGKSKYTLFQFVSQQEEEQRREELRKKSSVQQSQKDWRHAQEARQDDNYISSWQQGILEKIESIEELAAGNRIYKGYPQIGLTPSGIKAAQAALEELRNILQWSTPQIMDKKRESNVYMLRPEAYRGMQ